MWKRRIYSIWSKSSFSHQLNFSVAFNAMLTTDFHKEIKHENAPLWESEETCTISSSGHIPAPLLALYSSTFHMWSYSTFRQACYSMLIVWLDTLVMCTSLVALFILNNLFSGLEWIEEKQSKTSERLRRLLTKAQFFSNTCTMNNLNDFSIDYVTNGRLDDWDKPACLTKLYWKIELESSSVDKSFKIKRTLWKWKTWRDKAITTRTEQK